MKRILLSGLLGGLAAFVWILISNAMIPIKSDMIHQVAPNQFEIHDVLAEHITEQGTYTVPYLTFEQESDIDEYRSLPVYTVVYSGYTHGDQGSPLDLLVPIFVMFLVVVLAAWLLSKTSSPFLSGFGNRVLFVTLIGVVIALHDDVLQMFFGPQPKDYQVFLAINHVITWLLIGLVVAWKMKPRAVVTAM